MACLGAVLHKHCIYSGVQLGRPSFMTRRNWRTSCLRFYGQKDEHELMESTKTLHTATHWVLIQQKWKSAIDWSDSYEQTQLLASESERKLSDLLCLDMLFGLHLPLNFLSRVFIKMKDMFNLLCCLSISLFSILCFSSIFIWNGKNWFVIVISYIKHDHYHHFKQRK